MATQTLGGYQTISKQHRLACPVLVLRCVSGAFEHLHDVAKAIATIGAGSTLPCNLWNRHATVIQHPLDRPFRNPFAKTNYQWKLQPSAIDNKFHYHVKT
jgi:hypothetical protein